MAYLRALMYAPCQLRNQYQFLFLNVPHNFLAWLGLKLQEDRSMQMQRLSCRVIFLMRKQINVSNRQDLSVHSYSVLCLVPAVAEKYVQ